MTTWTNTTKPSNSFTNTTKPTTTWSDNIKYLVSQALDFLMTEDDNYIITNQSLGAKPFSVWNNLSK